MKPLARPELRDMPTPIHGSLNLTELREFGLSPKDVLDFSANINPFGPSPAVLETVASAPLDRYPDRQCLKLTAVLAESLRAAPEQILPGNGASELIWLAVLAFVHPGSNVLVLGPTFCEYARAAALMGARVTTWRAREETGFILEPKEISEHLYSLRPSLVFLCNPNNPTGAVLSEGSLEAWVMQYPQTLFVVDEAYLSFAPQVVSALALAGDNVLVLRSMTKDFSLAGLRLGYAVGDAHVIALLRQVQPPWSVNTLAQAAGVAALRDLGHRQDGLVMLGRAKEKLIAGLSRLGLTPLPSAAPFFLLRVGDGAAFRLRLLRHGVLVRDCASFGLAAYIRISTRRPEENERLLNAVQEVM